MANILLITLCDEFNLGARQLVALLRREGHDARLLCLKRYAKRTLAPDETPDPEWQVELLPGGQRSVLCYPFPITARESELFADLLLRLNPQLVGLSVYYSPQVKRAVEATRFVRAQLPTVPIVWGGPHATLDPEGALRECDLVVAGEGETAVSAIAASLDAGSDWREAPSVVFRGNGGLIRTPPAPLVTDLDSLPFACDDAQGVYYIDDDALAEGTPFSGSDLHRTHKLMTSRGCPFSCSYCMLSYQKEVVPASARLRLRSVPHVIAELEREKARRGTFYLEIEDDIFTLDAARMAEFFALYRERIATPFWCYTHPRFANDQTLGLLRDNGAEFVVMGIESGSDRIANEVFHRRTTGAQVREAARAISRSGLRAFYDLISNNPFEEEEDRIATFHLLRSLPRPLRATTRGAQFLPRRPHRTPARRTRSSAQGRFPDVPFLERAVPSRLGN